MNPTLGLPLRLALCCLLAGIVAVGGAAAEPAWIGERHIETKTERELENEHNETNNRLRIAIQPNGSAAVRVSYRVSLDDANETTAFQRLRADIRTNPARFTEQFAERMAETAATAEVATGREMAIENMSVRAARGGPGVGVVTYTFDWHGFAASDGERLSVGETLDGFVLSNGSRLVVAWPDGYEPVTIRPPPDERRPNAVVWTAPTTFNGSEPHVVLSSSGIDGSASDVGSTEEVLDRDTGISVLLIVLAAFSVVAVAIVMVYAVHRRRADETTTATEIDAETGPETGPPDATDGGILGPGIDDAAEPADRTDDTDMAELLSNEERVLRILEQHDGRMKQQQVVAALGWTEAKTSQVVSGLRAEGEVEGFRLGRENVLSLPDDRNGGETNGDNSA